MIIKFVAIHDFEALAKIIEVQQHVTGQSSPRECLKNREKGYALFPTYSLLLTCKHCYRVNRELLKGILVNNLSQFLTSHSAIFLFPKAMHKLMVNKYYPDTCRDLIKALYSENLVNDSAAIQRYVRHMNGNTVIARGFYPTLTMCMFLERIIGCTMKFMKQRKDHAARNCVAFIDYICSQEATDLRVCGINDNKKNLAQHVFDLFNGTYQAFFTHLSLAVQNKIKENCDVKECDHPPRGSENRLIIEDLIEAYVPPIIESIK